MKNKLFIAAGIIVLGIIIYSLINNDEKAIRDLTKNIAAKASFVAEDMHPFVYLQKGKELANHFSETTAVEIALDQEIHAEMFGHDQIIKNYTLARNHLDEISVKFDKLEIDISGDSATVNTTIVVGLTRRGANEDELYAEAVIVTVSKDSGEWLVTKIRNVELLEK